MDHIKENVHIKSRSMGRGRFIFVSEDRHSIVKLIFGVSRLRLFATQSFDFLSAAKSINDACMYFWLLLSKEKKTCFFLENRFEVLSSKHPSI